MSSADLQIEELATLPGRLLIGGLLGRWHGAEWSHLYNGWDETTAEAEFAAMSGPGTIPTTWVAFAGLGRSPADVTGSVTLALTDDLPGLEHLSPWLVSLYVDPPHRGHRVAAVLIDRLMREAERMGIDRVHLFTAGQERYYLDRGWRTLQYAQAHGHEAAVMVRHTDPRAARQAVCSGWISDPDFDGAYSYLRRSATPADRLPLSGAVNAASHPGLYLAGEAGSQRHPGTTHGAYFTGEQVARALLDDDPLPDPPAAATSARTDTASIGDMASPVGAIPARRPVVVIGAGVAGLAAARTLHDGGRRVILVEAKDRIGGRSATDWSLGVPVHLGAAWLHGEHGHPLAALGADGPATRWGDSGQFILDHGRHDPARAERADEVLHRRLAEAARQARPNTIPISTVPISTVPDSMSDSRDNPQDEAYAEAASRLLDELAQDPQLGLDQHDLLLLETWLRGEVESLYAAPWQDLSLPYGAEPYELPGDDRLVTQPFHQLLAPLAHNLDIRTATRATSVRALAPASAREAKAARWIIELDRADTDPTQPNPTLEARSVIVTVPIGVLRSERLQFEPALPPELRASLERVGAGPVAKVCFCYDLAFWDPLRSFWIAGEDPVPFGLWFDVSPLAGVPMLCAFAVGEDARWAESASEDELCQVADQLLRRARVGRP